MYDQWPGADQAVAALSTAFGRAYVQHTGGGCFSIEIPIEGMGFIAVGDIDGPLGESNNGWGADLTDIHGEYHGIICKVPDRSIPKLVDALRAFLRNRTRTGLTAHDWLCIRRDRHAEETGHWASPVHEGEPRCAECEEIHKAFQEPDR